MIPNLRHRLLMVAIGLLAPALLLGCATGAPDGAKAEMQGSDTPRLAAAADAPAPAARPAPPGPKKRVAVIRFENVGRFAQAYGTWDIGGGLAAQLTTALAESGYFVVVERAALGDVLREQEMGLEKVVSKETAAKAGQVLGAQLLVKGAVTEFEQAAEGGGVKLGVGLPGIAIGGGGNTVSAQVGIDLRLIDTTTGQVVRSVKTEGKAAKQGVAASIDVRNVSLGGDAFKTTPLGQATREAIERAVVAIRKHMEVVPWTGRVMDAADGQVYINAGQDANIQVGDVFTVSRPTRELKDPETGLVRGIIESQVGRIRVEDVQDKFAVARPLDGAVPQRGDYLKHTKGTP